MQSDACKRVNLKRARTLSNYQLAINVNVTGDIYLNIGSANQIISEKYPEIARVLNEAPQNDELAEAIKELAEGIAELAGQSIVREEVTNLPDKISKGAELINNVGEAIPRILGWYTLLKAAALSYGINLP